MATVNELLRLPKPMTQYVTIAILHAQALSNVKVTSIAGKELATMDEREQDKVAANLTTNLQKKVNKIIDLNQLRI